ncbi:MAG: hypothetical protein KatS3mg110_4210 [Pirellulaceae bacterium]|nr:MAG: hypothetical protein KatS3mg110_4210 [Pirellulaceae bacterium]
MHIWIAGITGGTGLAGLIMLWTARGISLRHRRGGFRVALFRAAAFLLLLAWLFLQPTILFASYQQVIAAQTAVGFTPPLTLSRLVATGVVGGTALLVAVITAWSRGTNRPHHLVLWVLRQAASRGVPLSLALESLSQDAAGRLRRRAARVVRLINLGWPLDRALRIGWGRTTVDGDFAVALGSRSGNLQQTLSLVDATDTSIPDAVDAIISNVWYAVGVIAGAALLMPNLLRSLTAALIEFRDPNPPAGDPLANLLTVFGQIEPFISIPPVACILVFVVVTLLVLSYHWGLIRGRTGFWNWLARPLDRARILEQLAAGMERGWPVQEYLQAMSEVYPKRAWRRRLKRAGRAAAAGAPLAEALGQGRLLTRPQAARFAAIDQGTVLAVHLRQLAIRMRQQFVARIAWFRQAILVTTVFVVGFVVGTMGVMLFQFLAVLDKAVSSWGPV